jgi:alkylation response protein AidB-like acyl-CoA dehydrogenase
MEFALSEEQQELASTVRSLLSKRADSAAVRSAMVSETGYDESLWQTLCEQIGAAALGIPEEYDGAGFSLLESFVVLEEVGRSLAPSPLLASLVTSEALLAGADDEAKRRLLPRIAAGEVAAYVVPGQPALFADQASVVVAVVDGTLVELDPASSDPVWLPSMDQTSRLGSLDATGGTPIASNGPSGAAAAERAALVGAAGVAALSAGLAARALEMTVDYSKERVQFGRPIGSFQALKHRMADMLVLVEMSRSASWAAAYAVSTNAPNAARLAHVAKSYCSDALNKIAAETVQLHGGIAITWEHDAQLVFKRAHALSQLYGQPHQHRTLIDL